MASSPSTVVLFPFAEDFEDNCLQRATTVNDTLISVMKSWIVTKKGSRLGNMVGCFLPDIIHDLININDLSGLEQQFKQDITQQFPGVNFIDISMNVDLSNKFVDLIIIIKFSTTITNLAEFSINLSSNIVTSN